MASSGWEGSSLGQQLGTQQLTRHSISRSSGNSRANSELQAENQLLRESISLLHQQVEETERLAQRRLAVAQDELRCHKSAITHLKESMDYLAAGLENMSTSVAKYHHELLLFKKAAIQDGQQVHSIYNLECGNSRGEASWQRDESEEPEDPASQREGGTVAPCGEWADVSMHILDTMKAAFVKGEGKAAWQDVMKVARQVNRHWYQWANGVTRHVTLKPVSAGLGIPYQNATMQRILHVFPQIEELTLPHGFKITKVGHRCLRKLYELRRVEMTGCKVVEDGLKWLLRVRTLRSLVLNMQWRATVTEQGCNVLQHLTRLEELRLEGLPRFWRWESIDNLSRLTSLTSLSLRCRQIEGNFVPLYMTRGGRICEQPSLTDLTIVGAGVPPDIFTQMANHASLTSLCLRSCGNGVNDDALGRLAGMTCLRSLRLMYCPALEGHGLDALTSLRSLRLEHCPSIQADWEPALTSLTSFKQDFCGMEVGAETHDPLMW
eukprot:evm.model.scf_1185.1 EVM.evm.TU.scf_1185.1   scf_1185:30462-35525(-)